MIYKFQVEVITPLVIAGADNRNPDLKAEGLRPPSLRGAMRFWFRAMMGGIVGGTKSYNPLRNLEMRLFGTTNQASTFWIRTYFINTPQINTACLRMNDPTPIQRGQRSLRAERQAFIPPAQSKPQFEVELHFYQESAVPLVLGALWLMAMLGGLGSRVRRGFGSLAFIPEDEQTKRIFQDLELNFSCSGESFQEIKNALQNQLMKVRKYFADYATHTTALSSAGSPAKFPVLAKTQAKLWLVKPKGRFWSKWFEAMDDLRERIYRAYRKSEKLREIGSAQPRQASPLLIQIKRTINHTYFGILLVFDEQGNKRQYLGMGWEKFTKFLEKLKNYYELQEVELP